MNLMEVLSQEDQDKFKSYVKYYNNSIASKYLDTAWAPFKEELFQMLGENLIVSFPVSFDCEERLLEQEFHNNFACNPLCASMYSKFIRMLKIVLFQDFKDLFSQDIDLMSHSSFYLLQDMYNSIEDLVWKEKSISEKQKKFAENYIFYNHVRDKLSPHNGYTTYFKNEIFCKQLKPLTVRDYHNFYTTSLSAYINNGEVKLTVSDKEKPFKFLKRITKKCLQYSNTTTIISNELNTLLDEIEEVRILQSQILSNKTVKGRLCLSIHPLDYITMSDNSNGWSSCMSWEESGCYRLGTLEMLSSPKVVIAYLESESETYELTPGIDWNSKKWRELFVIDENVISGVRGYPYYSKALEAAALNKLVELATTNLGWEFESEPINFNSTYFYPNGNSGHAIRMSTNAMYNDFGTQETLAYLGIKAKEITSQHSIYIQYGQEPYCLSCGYPISFSSDAEYEILGDGLECKECRDFLECEECGGLFHSEDLWEVNGQLICESCYGENYFYCEECQDFVSRNEELFFAMLGYDTIRNRVDVYYSNSIHENCLFKEINENGNDSNNILQQFAFSSIRINYSEDEAKKLFFRDNPQLKEANSAFSWFLCDMVWDNVLDLNNLGLYDEMIEDNLNLPSSVKPVRIPKEWIKFYESK